MNTCRELIYNRPRWAALVLSAALGLWLATSASAAPAPTSDLLLPYFEVQMEGPGVTTLFAVVNSSDREVPVLVSVHSNWGTEILQVPFTLGPHKAQSVNLRDWLLLGNLPGGVQLDGLELAHVQAALCGQESPQDGLYYSTEIQPRLAVGYATVRVQGSPRSDVLFGDYFVVDPTQDSAQGERLINIDPADPCGSGLCRRHALRFLEGGGFDSGTELIIWTSRQLTPTSGPYLSDETPVVVDASAWEEPGIFLGDRAVGTLPVQVVKVSDLALGESFGWLDVVTSEDSFIAVRYAADQRYSVGLTTVCLRLEEEKKPGLRIRKTTNGADAGTLPGISLAVGSEVTWEYVVTNLGDVVVTDVAVSDDDDSLTVSCPKTALEPGESMTCTAHGVAAACQYVNRGTAAGELPDGGQVADSDLSHYFGDQGAALDLELLVNGKDADQQPGPQIKVGDPVRYDYVVRNVGQADLHDVVVLDDESNPVACPKSALAQGESMTCTVHTEAQPGGHSVTGHARGKDACDVEAADADTAVYDCGCVEEAPSVDVEKATDGEDADSWNDAVSLATGDVVTWTYVVTNDGATPLHDVQVDDDDDALTVSCPKDALEPGESMTCTAQGMAGDQPYQNLGIVTALSHCDAAAIDTDPSHYVPDTEEGCDEGVVASLDLETLANGSDDATVEVGAPVTWTYEVTNTGNRTLYDLTVSDSLGLVITCPGNELAAGGSMTCTAQSTAQEGDHDNTASAAGHTGGAPECQHNAVAFDDAGYSAEHEETGDQGCTPGYWKNHTDSWPPTGYAPGQSVGSVFAAAVAYPGIGDASLLDALAFHGGSGVDGGARNLLRAAVAALLNSSHGGVGYPRSAASVIADVDAALASGDRDTMLSLAAALDGDNNLGCPLN